MPMNLLTQNESQCKSPKLKGLKEFTSAGMPAKSGLFYQAKSANSR